MPYGPRSYPLIPLPQAPDPMQSLAGLMSIANNVEQYQAVRKQRQKEQRREQAYAAHKGDPQATSAALTEAGDFEGAQFFAEQAQQARSKRDDTQAKAIIPFALTKDANGIDTYDRALLKREFTAANLTDRLPALFKGLDEADAAALNLQKAKREYAEQGFRALLDSVDAAGATPQALQLAAKKGVANGFWSEEDAAQILAHVGDDPTRAHEVVRRLRGEKPVLHNVPAGTSVIDAAHPEAGPVFTAPAAPARPNTIQEALLDPTLTPARTRDLLALQRQLSAAQRQPDAVLDPAAVNAVLQNPRLWRALNSELRGKMLAPLAKAGFSFPDAAEGMTPLEIERLRVADLRQLDREWRRPDPVFPGRRLMTDEQYAEEKARIEDFYRELSGETEPAKTRTPPPAAATRGMIEPTKARSAPMALAMAEFKFKTNIGGTVTVTAPDGTSATFPSRAEADAKINEFLNQR